MESLRLLQFLLTGIWQLANLQKRSEASLMMIVDKSQNAMQLPNIKQLRKQASNVSLNTAIEVDQKHMQDTEEMSSSMAAPPTSSSSPSLPPPHGKKTTTLEFKLAFNLNTIFDKKPDNKVPMAINAETAVGICLIGNLGLETLQSKVPALGFTDLFEVGSGIPLQYFE